MVFHVLWMSIHEFSMDELSWITFHPKSLNEILLEILFHT